MKIGFDFDKVFVDYPPFVPDFIIDYLYKNHKKSKEKYRYPNTIEQQLRIASHHPILRRPIKKNVEVLKIISKNKNNQTFLVSSRFSFLSKRTEQWLMQYGIKKYFKELYFNYENRQPHEFKYNRIKSLGLDYYIDDDLDLLSYLSHKKIDTKLFWLDGTLFVNKKRIPKNITIMHNLSEILIHIKNDK